MTEYDICRENFDALISGMGSSTSTRNEAATRLHTIDEIFFKCLGWNKADCSPEDHLNGEFADYIFSAPTRCLVVEAKREGISFELPAGFNSRTCKIQFFKKNFPDVYAAIEQVCDYAQKRGISTALATNGHQFIGFIAVRDDGISPLDGLSAVYSTLADAQRDFLSFWNFLSKEGVKKRLLKSKLIGGGSIALPIKLARTITGYPGVQRRNSLQADLQVVSEIVFEDLAKAEDLNEQFLRECYCESGALSQYALVSKTILETRYNALFNSSAEAPSVAPVSPTGSISPELFAESLSKRPVLLIGDVGVGKSSFINYLTTVHMPELKSKAVVIYIDLGSTVTLSGDVRQSILDSIEKQLINKHNIDPQDGTLVKSIYWPESKRFKTSIHAMQYSDEAQLEQKLIEHLASLVEKREDHLSRTLQFLSKSQKRQVIVFIDNTDQRSTNTQQKAFLVAQELSQSWHCAVFLSLRPTTYHASIKSGALSGYHPKAFSIAPPRIDKVIQRRLQYGIKLASGDIQIEALPKTIRINLQTLCLLLKILKASLDSNAELIEALDNLANGNVRRSLDFVRDFLSSGHVNTEKILKIYNESGGYLIATHEFMRALLLGSSVHFDPSRSEFVNTLDLRSPDPKDHFTIPILLGFLLTKKESADEQEWFSIPETIGAIQSYGYTDEQIYLAVKSCSARNLIHTSSSEEIDWESLNNTKIRINARGAYHHQRTLNKFYYMDAIIVDTPILDNSIRSSIYDTIAIEERLTRSALFIKYLSNCWLPLNEASSLFNWPACERELYNQIDDIGRRLARPKKT